MHVVHPASWELIAREEATNIWRGDALTVLRRRCSGVTADVSRMDVFVLRPGPTPELTATETLPTVAAAVGNVLQYRLSRQIGTISPYGERIGKTPCWHTNFEVTRAPIGRANVGAWSRPRISQLKARRFDNAGTSTSLVSARRRPTGLRRWSTHRPHRYCCHECRCRPCRWRPSVP
jgi:hypothetical protein